jgi:hypothetical protein
VTDCSDKHRLRVPVERDPVDPQKARNCLGTPPAEFMYTGTVLAQAE